MIDYSMENEQEEFWVDEVDLDPEAIEYVKKELERGNDWAWCTVIMRAHYKGWKGEAFLGSCSYKDEKDFRENSGYYEDLKKEALHELISSTEFAVIKGKEAEEALKVINAKI